MQFRQAIQTKYIGPTNTKGSRVRASCLAKTRFYTWQDELNIEQNHHMAALALAMEMEWLEKNTFIGGGLGKGRYVFVAAEKLANGLLRVWE